MDTSNLFPSKYLKASDLEAGPQTVDILELALEEVGQGKDAETKPVVYFQDRKKGLVLNVTNLRTIDEAYTTNSDAWVGKPVELFSTETDFQGKRVPCVRVRIPKAPSADELTGGSGPADLDDEVPFAPIRDLP
jgi:hypothetical protein